MSNAPPSWLSRNTLLSVLPASSLALLDTHIEPIECDLRRVLASPGESMKFVFFPTGGCVSMIRRLVDGRAAEVGLVGREGMVGLPVLLGNDISYVEALIQASGVMLRMSADTLRKVCREDPSLQQHFLRYALVFQNLTTQSAVCNGNHALEQRAARWLLMMHDRADGDEFAMTQEFLSMMLSVHRPAVNITARLFQQSGLISYGNGRLRVIDRPGLEASACECYAAVQEQFHQLLTLRPA
jgi:CRP-like cAMP-binding protein